MKKHLIAFIALMLSALVGSGQEGLAVGDKVPEFTAATDDGSSWNINKFIGRKYIVIYFYPAAMTGGCTKQACAYRDNEKALESADVVVVGVSGDKVENLKIFKEAENLNFTLLSDEKGEIAKSFGVPVGNGASITRTVEGTEYELIRGVTTKRWTFIVDKTGKIVYKNESVNPEKDTEEVLNFIKLHAAVTK